MFYVNVVNPTGTTARKVEADTFTVGRSDESDLVVADDTLSRRHLVIRRRGGELVVEDLGSSNGTFVNGERITAHAPIPLDPDDEVTMGDAEVRLNATIDAPTVVLAPIESRPARPRVPGPDAEAVTRMALAKATPAPATPPQKSSARPQILIGVIALTLLGVGAFVFTRRPPSARVGAVPERRVAALPPARLESTYRMSYVDNVIATPQFIERYLSDEFQSRLTRDLVPSVARNLGLEPGRVIQALGVTAELVKSLGDARGDTLTPDERLEAMRRLEADADAQLIELLGSRERVGALRGFEKSLYER